MLRKDHLLEAELGIINRGEAMTTAKMGTYNCLCCKEQFLARVADRKRGWARFCSKRCKAIKQIKTHGDTRFNGVDDFSYDPSWDAHKVGGM